MNGAVKFSMFVCQSKRWRDSFLKRIMKLTYVFRVQNRTKDLRYVIFLEAAGNKSSIVFHSILLNFNVLCKCAYSLNTFHNVTQKQSNILYSIWNNFWKIPTKLKNFILFASLHPAMNKWIVRFVRRVI